MIRIKRTYDPPAREDGHRVLVERLWPRGQTKAAVAADVWAKEVAPTTELRKWFDHQLERWEEFRRSYRAELRANPAAWEPILAASKRGTVTLLYSAHDPVHNGAAVLREFLTERATRKQAKKGAHRAVRAAGPRKPRTLSSKLGTAPASRLTVSRIP
jgi:uncharacterized protein YeaO (DUF488 family)